MPQNRRALLRLAFSLTLVIRCLPAQTNDPLATLRTQHPRLIALDSDIARIRSLVASDPLAKRSYDALRREADRMLSQPPVEYKLVGPRLLETSHAVLRRIYTLGLVYRIDGDRKYFERALAGTPRRNSVQRLASRRTFSTSPR